MDCRASPARFVILDPRRKTSSLIRLVRSKCRGFAFESDNAPLLIEEGYAPHVAGTPEQRAAYGLAALLVHVLGGERPGKAGADIERQGGHSAGTDPGVCASRKAVPDPVVELIKSGLSFEPDDRPELTTIEDELAGSVAELRTESLRSWSPTTVPALIQKQDAGYPDPDTARSRRHIDTADDSSSYEGAPGSRAINWASAQRDQDLGGQRGCCSRRSGCVVDNSQDSLGTVKPNLAVDHPHLRDGRAVVGGTECGRNG